MEVGEESCGGNGSVSVKSISRGASGGAICGDMYGGGGGANEGGGGSGLPNEATPILWVGLNCSSCI